MFFDLGVYLIVVGLVLDVLRSLGARVDVEMSRATSGGGGAMTTYLVPLVLIGGLTSAGVYLLLERNLTRMLLGLLLIGNADQPADPDRRRPVGQSAGARPHQRRRRPPPRIRWRRA